ncbi:GNAT family N-acetyltransferase [Brevibacillus fortis]|uniref:Sortase n=1 Tax=Brevibacillus fortis TaxID=2126352 RepID=A0A2P7UJ93_9BACL|nr:GNAT family N-acetyltransferase [Brevibacillus fortis]MED1784870.1 GNAT family N-acetyltransferase [Brevibacillus fortis]PSJ87017.1 sortase [Brevibacillus fortis]
MPSTTPFPAHSARLVFQPVTEHDFPELLTVYNSNPDYMEFAFGQRVVTLQTVADDHQDNLKFADSYSFSIREVHGTEIIGIAQFILCNPRDGHPWLGLIMLHSEYQSHGYAKEFLDTLLSWYQENGYTSLHLAVLEKNKRVIPFYEKYGFVAYEEREHEKLGLVICMAYPIQS